MSSIVFDLSPPEATKNFIDGLKRKQVLTRDFLRELQRTSLSAGVHPADYERLFLEYAKSDHGTCIFTCPCCGTTQLSLLTACKTCKWDIPQYLKYMTEKKWERDEKNLKTCKQARVTNKHILRKNKKKNKEESPQRDSLLWENLADNKIQKIVNKKDLTSKEINDLRGYLSLFPRGQFEEQTNERLDRIDNSPLDHRDTIQTLKERGTFYYNKNNLGNAFECFTKAAKYGDPEAHYYLGQVYMRGCTAIPQNVELAKKHYTESTKYEHPQAKKALRIIKHLETAPISEIRSKNTEDDALWEKCKSIDTAGSYNEYLGKNPNGAQGKHFKKAQQELKSKQKKERYRLKNIIKLNLIKKTIGLIVFILSTILFSIKLNFKDENQILIYQNSSFPTLYLILTIITLLIVPLLAIFPIYFIINTLDEYKMIIGLIAISFLFGSYVSYVYANYESYIRFINYIF